jgi:hypothetical protein
MEGQLVLDQPETQVASLPGHVEYQCARCGSTARIGSYGPATFHPAVEGFLYERGHDVGRDPSWSYGSAGLPETTVRSTDPPKIAVRFGDETDSLTAVIGPDATVQSIETTGSAADTA